MKTREVGRASGPRGLALRGLGIGAGLWLGVAGACDGGTAQDGAPAPSRSRVNAVEAAAPEPVDLSGFCERLHEPDAAPPLTWPALRGPAPSTTGRTRWINVWATWCKPCIEELPRLARWRDALSDKLGFELVFLSADADPEAVKAFAAEHPEVVGSLQLDDASALDPWLTGLGLAGSAFLPVHVFVDGEGRARCLRTTGIGEDDRNAIEQLLVSL